MGRKELIYALYKGDEFLDMGTKREIAERQNVSLKTIHHYTTPSYKNRFAKRDKRNRRVLIRVDDEC